MEEAKIVFMANVIQIILLVLLLIHNPALLYEEPKSWCYILQDIDPYMTDYLGCKILVTDYSMDGTNETAYSREEIEYVKSQGIKIYAYLSIGEAEDYRFYWNDTWNHNPPYWILDENPEWPGNYLILYWVDEWRNILARYIDIIISQGFNGLYLDRIDSFEYLTRYGYRVEYTSREMYRLIKWIRQYIGNDMEIILQNGEEIIRYYGNITSFIDAWAVEDLFYMGLKPLDRNESLYRIDLLKDVINRGKEVLVVDYVYNGLDMYPVYDFHLKSRIYGFIPYAASYDRDLDEIIRIYGVQPETNIFYLVEKYSESVYRF